MEKEHNCTFPRDSGGLRDARSPGTKHQLLSSMASNGCLTDGQRPTQRWTEKAAYGSALWARPCQGARVTAQLPLTSNCGQFMDMPGPWLALNHLRSSTASAARMFCSRSR